MALITAHVFRGNRQCLFPNCGLPECDHSESADSRPAQVPHWFIGFRFCLGCGIGFNHPSHPFFRPPGRRRSPETETSERAGMLLHVQLSVLVAVILFFHVRPKGRPRSDGSMQVATVLALILGLLLAGTGTGEVLLNVIEEAGNIANSMTVNWT
jgi:hypothetical protein